MCCLLTLTNLLDAEAQEWLESLLARQQELRQQGSRVEEEAQTDPDDDTLFYSSVQPRSSTAT